MQKVHEIYQNVLGCWGNPKFWHEILILLPTFITIREIIAIVLTMAKRTYFIDKLAPFLVLTLSVTIQSTRGSFSFHIYIALNENPWYSGSQPLVSMSATEQSYLQSQFF